MAIGWKCSKHAAGSCSVRTPAGVEGWTDTNLLLTQQQMDDLHRLAESAAKLPSQGAATVFDALNMHAQPTANRPAFIRSRKGLGGCDRPSRRAAICPRPRRSRLVHRAAAAAKKSKAKDPNRPGPPPPPPPVPPTPPKNWEDLSRPRASTFRATFRLPRDRTRPSARRLEPGAHARSACRSKNRSQSRLGAVANAAHVDSR